MISLRQQAVISQFLSGLETQSNRALPYAVIAGWLMISTHLVVNLTGLNLSFGLSDRISQIWTSKQIVAETPAAEFEELNIATSPLVKEVSLLNRKFPNLIRFQRHSSTKQDLFLINAKGILRTDKNRPRVNGDVADLLHPFMAKARLVYKTNVFVLIVPPDVPASYIKPIVKFIKSFYGWNVSVVQGSQSQDFSLQMAVK